MAGPMIVVMGVSGCGKSTIGRLLAQRTGWAFADADELHPAANVEKMARHIPLTDADRWPWLDDVAAWIAARRREGVAGVMACSALKRSYRDRLREADARLRLVFLHGGREILTRRLVDRHGHFFPAQLLDSQFADLEPPTPDEDPITIEIGQSPEAVVDAILTALGHAQAAR